MTTGTPLLIGNNQSGPLARVPLKDDSDQQFQECFLQDLINRWPEILPIRDFYPTVNGLCSLGCEIPIDMGDTEGSIDNLLLTDDGHLVIVETKLWRNPESLRKVVAQILQYGMAVSQLSLDEFEGRLRRGNPKGRLGPEETILQRARGTLSENTDDFEDAFDRMRVAGEILLLIVGDGIRPSAERLVQWINKDVAGAPCKFGLVEFCVYDLPEAAGRVVVPKTLLRIREASRHVVSINIQNADRQHVTATVSAPDELPNTRPIAPSGTPLTEEGLTAQIMAKNPPEVAELAAKLRSQLDLAGLKKRALPATIQYGVEVSGDFIPLLSLNAANVWFGIPMRTVRDLGGERFVACKQKINSVAEFYRSEDVSDPDKTNALGPRYAVLQDKIDALVEAVVDIKETVRLAVTAAS
jgi:hypothetical protein